MDFDERIVMDSDVQWFRELDPTSFLHIGAHSERLRHESADAYRILRFGFSVMDQLARGEITIEHVEVDV